MKRVELLRGAAALGLFSAGVPDNAAASPLENTGTPLTPPSDGVPVAFLVSNGAVMIDFAGPWEVFQDATVPGRTTNAFNLYTVAETTKPITVSAGAKLIPQFDLASAPTPKVVVVPGQPPQSENVNNWLRSVARKTDVMMSVCTGALVLAAAGLLDGHTVTTHHGSLTTLTMQYSKVRVKRGVRFVDEGKLATAAGLTAGIDLALHILQRYYGQANARETAYYMEYLSQGWTNPASNAVYAKPPAPRSGKAICPVCWMNVDPKTAITLMYKSKRYYFCTPDHEQRFETAPDMFLPA